MPKSPKAFKRTVMNYYRAHGRSDLPWRKTADPYRILVSEFMLQQTQVSRVLEYYPRLLKAFPTVRHLARAPLADVLKQWQGLGYNRRAKMLKQCAEVIVREHGSAVPKDFDTLCTLPGVGQSTAGAVRAFAFNVPSPFIETNIRRAYIHFFFPDKNAVTDSELTPFIEKTLDTKDPRTWYWALMDYGSHLPKVTPNANRKSAHYKKQPAFAGSTRQTRGAIIRTLTETPSLGIAAIARAADKDTETIHSILSSLCAEGFIIKKGRGYALA